MARGHERQSRFLPPQQTTIPKGYAAHKSWNAPADATGYYQSEGLAALDVLVTPHLRSPARILSTLRHVMNLSLGSVHTVLLSLLSNWEFDLHNEWLHLFSAYPPFAQNAPEGAVARQLTVSIIENCGFGLTSPSTTGNFSPFGSSICIIA